MPNQHKPDPRRLTFIDRYLATSNATQAAREAGYGHPGSMGARLLQSRSVQEEIARRSKEIRKVNVADIRERREILTMMARPVLKMVKDPATGEFVEEYVWSKQALGAIDLLNKMDGVYILNVNVSGQLTSSPEEIFDKTVEMYRKNPQLWARLKDAVEGDVIDVEGREV